MRVDEAERPLYGNNLIPCCVVRSFPPASSTLAFKSPPPSPLKDCPTLRTERRYSSVLVGQFGLVRGVCNFTAALVRNGIPSRSLNTETKHGLQGCPNYRFHVRPYTTKAAATRCSNSNCRSAPDTSAVQSPPAAGTLMWYSSSSRSLGRVPCACRSLRSLVYLYLEVIDATSTSLHMPNGSLLFFSCMG